METLTTKPMRGTDRLLQTVAALARLLDQTMNDIQSLDSEFREEVERNSAEVERLREAATGWEAERTVLRAECDRARDLVEQSKREHNLALADSDEAAAIALDRQISTAVERVRAELTARWDADRATIVGDRNRAQQRLADVVTECDDLRKELEQARQNAGTAAAKSQPADAHAIQTEVTRVEGLIHSISAIVEDHNTELSVVIRKNVERAELESYLRGLRFQATL